MESEQIYNILEQKKIIYNWEKELKRLLHQKEKIEKELYIIDHEWFLCYKKAVLSDKLNIITKIKNYNSFEPINDSFDRKSINPNSNFILLNRESLESFSSDIIPKDCSKIKLKVIFFKGKMLSDIKNNLYYFLYLDENDLIKDGFFIFEEDQNDIEDIFNYFYENEIKVFITHYFNNVKPNYDNNKKCKLYHSNDYDIILRNSENYDENNLNTNNTEKINSTKLKRIKIKKDDMNNLYSYENKNLKNHSKNNNLNNNVNNSVDKTNKTNLYKHYDKICNKIVNCIYEYFYSQKELELFINNQSQKIKNFMPINIDWINDFLLKCSYNNIKEFLLKNEKTSLNFKSIIKNYLIENNITSIEMNNIPSITRNILKNQYEYYNNYELINCISYDAFRQAFGINNNTKEFNLFIIGNNHLIIKYNSFSGEIRNTYKNENYYIYSEKYFDKIKDDLVKYGLINGLSIYNAHLEEAFKELILYDKYTLQSIGILINLNSLSSKPEDVDNEIINNEKEVLEEKIINKEEDPKIKITEDKYKNNYNKYFEYSSIKLSNPKNVNVFNFEKNNIILINSEQNSFKNNNLQKGIYAQQNSDDIIDIINNNIYKKKKIPYYDYEKSNKSCENELSQKNYKNLEKKETEEEKGKITAKGLIRLYNIGTTCYMNAIILCFSNIKNLREELLKNDIYNELFNGRNKGKRLSLALAEVFKNLWQEKPKQYYSPKYFKNIISNINPLYKDISSNDSKDLILFFLETIHNELNQKFKNPYTLKPNKLEFFSVFNEFHNFYKSNNQSIISDEFYGYYNSMIKCCSCDAVIHNVQILNELFFPLEEVWKFKQSPYNLVTLDNCFEYYETPQLLKDNNNIYCNYCKINSPALTQNKIIIAPKTIIINLNRGKGLQCDIVVHFNQLLNLKKYIFYNEKSPYYYELVGVISRLVTNDMEEHFIAYCKNSYDSKWYKYNDAQVTESSFKEITEIGLPYVFFYSCIDA